MAAGKKGSKKQKSYTGSRNRSAGDDREEFAPQMTTLSQKTAGIVQKYEFAFRKQFGQNFLIDQRVLDRIVEASGVNEEDLAIEVGPGIGTLTECLAAKAREVVAVEIDHDLIPILQDTLSEYPNVSVINEDIMKVDLNQLVQEKNGGRKARVVANLPYYITTPIIMGLFEKHVPVRSITVMVQKEVALRMQAGPGSKDYGALSLAVQFYSKPEIVANAPANCFMPRPKVGSAVIHMECYDTPPVSVQDEKALFALIRAAFGQRRKTLVNAVGNSAEVDWTKEQVADALAEMGIKETIRGEALTLEQFARLADRLCQM